MNAQKEDIMLLKGIEMLFTQPFKSVWLFWVYFLLKSVFVYTVKVNKVPCCFRTISWCFSGLKQFWDKNNTCFGFLRSQSVIQALPKTNGLGSLHHGASLRTALLTCLSVCSFLSMYPSWDSDTHSKQLLVANIRIDAREGKITTGKDNMLISKGVNQMVRHDSIPILIPSDTIFADT